MAGEKPDLSNALQGILSNPEALSSIMSIVGNIKGNSDAKEPKKSEAGEISDTPVFNPFPSAQAAPIPAQPPFKYSERSREKELLLALKPFLSNRKCETIDTFVRLLDIVSLLGGVK